MKTTRHIQQIIPARIYNMGDMKVRQPLPSPELDYLDPFVLLHHGHMIFDESIPLNKSGVGPHPHKGFAPVTFLFKGKMNHKDSRGNNQTIGAGGTQWMHAGMGIIHSERPEAYEQELIQMWINSPAKHKYDQPYYHPLSKEATPYFTSQDGLVQVNVITGQLENTKGPIPTLSEINSATLELKASGKITLNIPETHNAFLYLLDGLLLIDGKKIEGKNFVEFKREGSEINIDAIATTRCLFMSGEPISEKIVAQGPFVMNNETEIMEAYRDYRIGKFGVLIED